MLAVLAATDDRTQVSLCDRHLHNNRPPGWFGAERFWDVYATLYRERTQRISSDSPWGTNDIRHKNIDCSMYREEVQA